MIISNLERIDQLCWLMFNTIQFRKGPQVLGYFSLHIYPSGVSAYTVVFSDGLGGSQQGKANPSRHVVVLKPIAKNNRGSAQSYSYVCILVNMVTYS